MKLRFLWPGRTKNAHLVHLQTHFLERINRLEPCELVEIRDVKGFNEKAHEKITI